MPLRPCRRRPRTGGNRDTFVVELDPPYTAFTYATYLGGSNNDEGSGVAVDRVGRVFTAGAASYPSPGALGASDAFIYGISSGAGRRRHRRRRPARRLGNAVRHRPAHATTPAADPDGDGFTNAQEFANNTHPTGYFTRYLAEGSTGAFFDDRIALFNPGARHRDRRAALPARHRRRDPAGAGRLPRAAAPPSTPRRSSASRTPPSRRWSRATSRSSSIAR